MPILPQQAIDDKSGATFTVDPRPGMNTLTLSWLDDNGNPVTRTFTLARTTLAQADTDIAAYFTHASDGIGGGTGQ
jgi:hypothetical protein